ncbi:MAG: positive regulator of sigma E activity [Maribacter sp.]|jgi:hypothetical protein
MKDKNPSSRIGNLVVLIGLLLTSFSFTVFIGGNSQIIVAVIGVLLAIYGFYLLRKAKRLRSE